MTASHIPETTQGARRRTRRPRIGNGASPRSFKPFERPSDNANDPGGERRPKFPIRGLTTHIGNRRSYFNRPTSIPRPMTSVVLVFSSIIGVGRTIAYLGRLNGGAYDGILGVLLSTRGGCDGSVSDLRRPPTIRCRTFENLPRSVVGPSRTSHDPLSDLREPPRTLQVLPSNAVVCAVFQAP